MPWDEFDRIGGEVRTLNERTQGLMLLAGLLVTATVAVSLAVPHLSLLISIAGGLIIVAVLTTATGQWHELRDGLHAAGGVPPVLHLVRIAWLLSLADLKQLAQGGRHDEHRTASGRDTSAS